MSSLASQAKAIGMNPITLYMRLRRGMSLEVALAKPVRSIAIRRYSKAANKSSVSRFAVRNRLKNGLTLEQALQDPATCEGCGRARGRKALCADHDHLVGTFRGFLCDGCNMILGMAQDDPERLLKLAEYLKRN